MFGSSTRLVNHNMVVYDDLDQGYQARPSLERTSLSLRRYQTLIEVPKQLLCL